MEKIGYIINSIKNNGPSKVVIELIENLNGDIYKPVLITIFDENDSGIVDQLRMNGVQVIELKKRNRLAFIIFGNSIINEICLREQIRLLHSQGFVSDIILSMNHTVKSIATVHNNLYEDYRNTYGKIKGKIYDLFHWCALKRLENVVCCSKSVKENLSNRLEGLDYIRNGITVFHPKSDMIHRKDCGIPEDAVVYIYAGALSELKNILFLVNEFKKYHSEDEYLLILGEGDLKEKAMKLSDSHVKFMGFQTNIEKYLQISNIYISASSSEGFSISVVQALSYGLALFLSDIPSHREIFEIEQGVYLGELFSRHDFHIKMDLLRKNKSLISKEVITEFYENNLSAKEMAYKYQKKYYAILENS